jgi:acetyl-CoA acetyltransferase
VGPLQQLPHGQHRRAGGPEVRRHARRAGRLRGREPSPRGRRAAGRAFDAEIFAVEIKQKKGDPIVFKADEGPRGDSDRRRLAKLRPAFKPNGGTVTAGNASSINDGAAALVVVDEDYAKAHGLKPLARITGYATGGLAPEWVMMAPEVATRKLCALLKCSPQTSTSSR